MDTILIDSQDPIEALKYIEAMTERLELRRQDHYKIAMAIALIRKAIAPMQANRNMASAAKPSEDEQSDEVDSDVAPGAADKK